MNKAHSSAGGCGHGLALIGCRGTGKSTVGRVLASRMNRTFLDCDREVEARAGRSIPLIFAEGGEPAFRDREEETLAELMAASPDAIIATGGGAVLRETNRRRIREFGFVVWLTAPSSELARRIESDRVQLALRPPLTSAGTLAEIAQVLAARTPLYEELADVVVETTQRTPDEIASAIIDAWSK